MDIRKSEEILRSALAPLLAARGWEMSELSVKNVSSASTPGGHAIQAEYKVVHGETTFVAGDYGEPDDEIEKRIRSSAAAICEQLPHLKDPKQIAYWFGYLPLLRENSALKEHVPTCIQLDIARGIK